MVRSLFSYFMPSNNFCHRLQIFLSENGISMKCHLETWQVLINKHASPFQRKYKEPSLSPSQTPFSFFGLGNGKGSKENAKRLRRGKLRCASFLFPSFPALLRFFLLPFFYFASVFSPIPTEGGSAQERTAFLWANRLRGAAEKRTLQNCTFELKIKKNCPFTEQLLRDRVRKQWEN